MKNCTTKFVVVSHTGSYDTFMSTPIGIYDSYEEAENFIKEEDSWKEKIKTLSIRDLDYWEDGYSEETLDNLTENSNPYSILMEKFEKYIEELISSSPDYNKLDEYEALDKYYELHDSNDCLRDFMETLGYSEEVIEATVEYNDQSDSSRYNKSYSIREVPYYNSESLESLINRNEDNR